MDKKPITFYAIRISDTPTTKRQRKLIGEILRDKKDVKNNVHVKVLTVPEAYNSYPGIGVMIQSVNNIDALQYIVRQTALKQPGIDIFDVTEASIVILPEYDHNFIFELIGGQYCPVLVENDKHDDVLGRRLTYQEYDLKVMPTKRYMGKITNKMKWTLRNMRKA